MIIIIVTIVIQWNLVIMSTLEFPVISGIYLYPIKQEHGTSKITLLEQSLI